MKKFSTTNLYNSLRCTMFVLVFSSYDKVKINLFTNHIYLSSIFMKLMRDVYFMNNVIVALSNEEMTKINFVDLEKL